MSTSVVARYRLLFEDLASRGLLRVANNARNMQASLQSAGRSMTQNVTLPIVAVGALSLKAAGDFEAAMNGVSAVSGAVGKDFEALRNKAKELGATTAYSASEAAKGMEFLAMAGMNTEQVLSTIPSALNLASAGNIELAETADIMSNIMSGMGIAASESARVADVLAKASSRANVDVAMLGETMKYVAPVAKQMGLSLEETAAMAGILGNAGIQASMAGTTLRGTMLHLATNTQAQGALHALGVSAVDAEGNMRSLPVVLAEINKAMKGMGSKDRIDFSKDLSGTTSVTGFMAILDAIDVGGLENLQTELENSAGAAQAMADIRMEGFNGSMKTLWSAVESLQIAIGDSGLLEGVTSLINKFAEWIRQISSTNPELLKLGTTIALVAAAIGPLMLGASALIKTFMFMGSTVATVFKAFKFASSAIGLLANPIGLAVVAIVALVAAGVWLYRNWDMIKTKATEIFASLPAPIQEMGRNIMEVFNLIKAVAIPVFTIITAVATTQFALLKGIVTTAFQIIVGVIGTHLAIAKAIIGTAINVMAMYFNMGFGVIKTIVMTALNVIKALFTGNWQAIPGIINAGIGNVMGIIRAGVANIISAFAGLAGKLLQIGKNIVQGLINGIKAKAGQAIQAAKDLASKVGGAVKNFFAINSPSRLFTKFGAFLSLGLAGGIKAKAGAAIAQAQRMASAVAGATSGIGQSLSSTLGRDATIAAEAKSDLMMTHRFEFDFAGKIDGATTQVNTTYKSNGTNAGSNMPVMI